MRQMVEKIVYETLKESPFGGAPGEDEPDDPNITNLDLDFPEDDEDDEGPLPSPEKKYKFGSPERPMPEGLKVGDMIELDDEYISDIFRTKVEPHLGSVKGVVTGLNKDKEDHVNVRWDGLHKATLATKELFKILGLSQEAAGGLKSGSVHTGTFPLRAIKKPEAPVKPLDRKKLKSSS